MIINCMFSAAKVQHFSGIDKLFYYIFYIYAHKALYITHFFIRFFLHAAQKKEAHIAPLLHLIIYKDFYKVSSLLMRIWR